ncbi:response regulator transcription factor [Paenibacillus rhizoplanae]
MRILIVDDEPRHLRGMVNLIGRLRPEDQVEVAKDGLSAMEAVKAHHPDAILTDIRMPVMDGLEFLERLKLEDIKNQGCHGIRLQSIRVCAEGGSPWRL